MADPPDVDDSNHEPTREKLSRRTVRWKTRRGTIKGAEDNFITSRTQRLVKTVQQKDIDGLKKQLQELNQSSALSDLTNIQDEYAVSVLEHTVRSGSTNMLDALLTFCHTDEEFYSAIQRAILFAIKTNNIDICRYAIQLNHAKDGQSEICSDNSQNELPQEDANVGYREHTGTSMSCVVAVRMHTRNAWIKQRTLSTISQMDESEFSEEMTPIVMAAQLERTEIIRMLMDECYYNIHPLTRVDAGGLLVENESEVDPGFQIPPNHKSSSCYVCQEQANFVGQQTVEACRKAIEVYKALSSPAYMFQAGVEDPILEAFVISDIMERRKVVDPAFVKEYNLISQKCKKLALDLLGLCRTGSEVTALLNHEDGIEKTHWRDHTAQFPRLAVAIYYNQKEFVAHPHCQQVIQNIWYKGLPNWVCHQNAHTFRIFIYVLLMYFAMPFISIMYLFKVPCFDTFVRRPVTKFIFDITTFMTFLVLLFINTSFREAHVLCVFPRPMEILIMIWLAGYTLRFLRMMRRQQCFSYTSYGQAHGAIYEGTSIVFFWIHFALKLGLYAAEDVEKRDMATDRLKWKYWDAFLWCEIFYSLGAAIAVVHIYIFFKMCSALGPLQISLKSMLSDVFCFLILFVVIISAFAIALNTLYTGYPNLVQGSGDTAGNPSHFSSLRTTYKVLFWSLFGYGEPENVAIFVKNTSAIVNGTGSEDIHAMGHWLTESVGFGLYGLYHMFVIVVLLNMLVAMMANTYNVVAANCITEWRVAWTRLILIYMNDLGVLVPPFNILPIRFLFGLFSKKKGCCNRHDDADIWCTNYKAIMDSISKRYWRQREEAEKEWTI